MEIIKAKVVEIENINPTVKLFKLNLGKEISFEPGQFGTCMFEIKGEKVNRSYSYSSKEWENVSEIEFSIRLNPKGKATPFIFEIEKDFEIQIIGPVGKMILPQSLDSKKEINFFATGTGVGPFRSMVRKALKNGNKVNLFFGCSTSDDILFKEEWEELSNKNKNFKFNPVLSSQIENWTGCKGYVQDFITKDISNKIFVLCGNPFMAKDALEKLESFNVSNENIIYEKWIK